LTSDLDIILEIPSSLVSKFFFSGNDIRLFLIIFRIVTAVFEVSLGFDVFLEIIKNFVLFELVPEKVDVGVVRVILLESPPRAIGPKEILNE
jgi:hypothetical protein